MYSPLGYNVLRPASNYKIVGRVVSRFIQLGFEDYNGNKMVVFGP